VVTEDVAGALTVPGMALPLCPRNRSYSLGGPEVDLRQALLEWPRMPGRRFGWGADISVGGKRTWWKFPIFRIFVEPAGGAPVTSYMPPGPVLAPGSDAGLGFGVATPGGPEPGPRDTLPE
jgi:hypothetical protein